MPNRRREDVGSRSCMPDDNENALSITLPRERICERTGLTRCSCWTCTRIIRPLLALPSQGERGVEPGFAKSTMHSPVSPPKISGTVFARHPDGTVPSGSNQTAPHRNAKRNTFRAKCLWMWTLQFQNRNANRNARHCTVPVLAPWPVQIRHAWRIWHLPDEVSGRSVRTNLPVTVTGRSAKPRECPIRRQRRNWCRGMVETGVIQLGSARLLVSLPRSA